MTGQVMFGCSSNDAEARRALVAVLARESVQSLAIPFLRQHYHVAYTSTVVFSVYQNPNSGYMLLTTNATLKEGIVEQQRLDRSQP